MGAVDFRVGGRIFATLASVKEGYGNLMLTPETAGGVHCERPDLFLPIHGGWGRMGMTHIRLAVADEDSLRGALHTAWKLRVEKNQKASRSASQDGSAIGRRAGRSISAALPQVPEVETLGHRKILISCAPRIRMFRRLEARP